METTNLNLQSNVAKLRPRLTEKCPRCNSIDTKFCYYNNYSLNQPRHYCKTCRRYWTYGGICRNIPIGGSSYSRNIRANVTRCPATIRPNVPNGVRRRLRRDTRSKSFNVDVAGGDNQFNDLEHIVSEFGHTMSNFGSMSVQSFDNNVVNVSNSVAPWFGSFQPPPPQPQPLSVTNVDAWHSESLSLTSGPPLVSYDIDVINDQWFHDLHGYVPSPPLSPPQPPPHSD